MTSRVRVLPGSHNVRDLGGLPTADGGEVVTGRVFRSDYPAFATDPEVVRRLGLRTVVDLRRGEEAELECVPWSELDVAYHRTPITAGGETSWEARYPAYLSSRPDTVVEAVRQVLDPANQPVLFHCAAGKDRTGIVAALVLSLLGVPDELIVDDYVLSAPAVPAVLERLRSMAPYAEMLAATDVAGQTPVARSMEHFLAHVASQGGAESWLLAHGLTSSELAAGRAALLG